LEETGLTTSLKDRQIFAMGKWRASTGPVDVTSQMLDDIVASYNGLNSKITGFAIPIKLGHNKRVGEPAYGYAENVRRNGDTLIADFADVPPEIVDAISQRRYNAVSVELRPKIEYAGNTFPNVLSGVALLGAEWPAVKGLEPIFASEFAEEGALMLSQEEDADMNFTQEQHDAILASAVAKAKDEAKAETAAELTAAKTALEAAEQARDTANAALEAFRDEAEKSTITAVIEAAEKAGKIVPANKAKIAAFAETIRTSVAKGDARKALLDQFSEFVGAMPVKVGFKEASASTVEEPGSENVQTEINAKVAEKRKATKDLSYKDALALVFEENPDLKTRYAEER
jgi:hypothetical protein